MSEPRTEAGRQLGSLVHQLAPTKTLPNDDAVRVNAAIAKVETQAVALDRAALVAAVDGLQPILVSGTDGKEFDSGWVSRANVVALLNTLPAAPTIDSAAMECPMCGGAGRIVDITDAINEAQAAGTLLLAQIPAAPTIDSAQWASDLRDEMAVEFDDARIGYVTVQINRRAWDDLNALADALLHRGETGT